MNNVDYVMACVECGENKAWPEYLCTDCDEETAMNTTCTCKELDDDLIADGWTCYNCYKEDRS